MSNKLFPASSHLGENQKTAIGRKEEPVDYCCPGTCAKHTGVKFTDNYQFPSF